MKTLIGFDVGTYNLITCSGVSGSDTPAFYQQVTAYMRLKKPGASTRLVLKQMNKPVVPYGTNGEELLLLGRDAVELASDFGTAFERPMRKGCVGSDAASYPILASMLEGMLDRVSAPGETIVCFSKPANAVSQDTNVDLHESLITGIMNNYFSNTSRPDTKVIPMNEAAAIIYSECPETKTGLAISTGAGMVNVAYVKYGITIFAFSIAQSGDYIDESVAQATGMSIAAVNLRKTECDISKAPSDQFELILKAQYELLIRSSLSKIVEGIESNKSEASTSKDIPLVIAGGVSSISGFMPMFSSILEKYKLPLKISQAKRAEQGVMAIAHGLYNASQFME